MAQNSTVLQQWRSPYRCSELLSHQVRAHIKHSTINTVVFKIKGRYAHFSATCSMTCRRHKGSHYVLPITLSLLALYIFLSTYFYIQPG
jgi:hypothetical protein